MTQTNLYFLLEKLCTYGVINEKNNAEGIISIENTASNKMLVKAVLEGGRKIVEHYFSLLGPGRYRLDASIADGTRLTWKEGLEFPPSWETGETITVTSIEKLPQPLTGNAKLRIKLKRTVSGLNNVPGYFPLPCKVVDGKRVFCQFPDDPDTDDPFFIAKFEQRITDMGTGAEIAKLNVNFAMANGLVAISGLVAGVSVQYYLSNSLS